MVERYITYEDYIDVLGNTLNVILPVKIRVFHSAHFNGYSCHARVKLPNLKRIRKLGAYNYRFEIVGFDFARLTDATSEGEAYALFIPHAIRSVEHVVEEQLINTAPEFLETVTDPTELPFPALAAVMYQLQNEEVPRILEIDTTPCTAYDWDETTTGQALDPPTLEITLERLREAREVNREMIVDGLKFRIEENKKRETREPKPPQQTSW